MEIAFEVCERKAIILALKFKTLMVDFFNHVIFVEDKNCSFDLLMGRKHGEHSIYITSDQMKDNFFSKQLFLQNNISTNKM